MALFEVSLSGTYYAQRWINRFHYWGEGTAGTQLPSFSLRNAIGLVDSDPVSPGIQLPEGSLVNELSDCWNPGVTCDLLQIINVYDPIDFYSSPLSPVLTGKNNNGDQLSPVLAYKLRSTRVRSDIRAGQKAIVGVNEGDLAPGGNIASGTVTKLNALATAMSAVLTVSDGGASYTFTPCVVQRQKYIPDPAKPEKYAYRYYATLAEQEQHLAKGVQWSVISTVRTQVSRQYGRGI
jgi:hypothetical protein